MEKKLIKIIGLDFSLNHFGIVCLNSEEIDGWGYLTTRRKFFNDIELPKYARKYFLESKNKKIEDTNNFISRRREQVLSCLNDFFNYFGLLRNTENLDVYVCMEDYAYNTLSRSTHQTAELSGIIRHYFWMKNFKLRLIGPTTLKLWAIGGRATKRTMVACAFTDITMPSLCTKFPITLNSKLFEDIKKTGDIDGPITDIADAFILASLLKQELRLRSGDLTLAQISNNQKKVFSRISKSQPINLLDLNFIERKTVL